MKNPLFLNVMYRNATTSTSRHVLVNNNYYPYGLLIADSPQSNNRLKFQGKELQTELHLNTYDFHARMYDPVKVITWQLDPLASEFYSTSPYSFLGGNPLKFIDPTGKKLRYAKGTSRKFRRKFRRAVKHLNKHGAGGILAKLEARKNTYYIGETKKGSQFVFETKTILWNSEQGITTTNDKNLSPSTVLNHEADHALSYDKNPEEHRKNSDPGTSKNYETKEEERVIIGSEQETAKNLGEIEEGEVTRTDHAATPFQTSDPTSNIPETRGEQMQEVIIKYKRDDDKIR